MSIPPPNPLSYEGQVVVPYIIRNFAPTSSNNTFSVPTIWINPTAGTSYILVAKPLGVADWLLMAHSAGDVGSFLPDSGTSPVVPNGSGQISMTGSGSLTTVGGTNSITFELDGLTNHAVLLGQGTSTIGLLGPSSTVGSPLISSGASADPAYSTTFTVNDAGFFAKEEAASVSGLVQVSCINTDNTNSSSAARMTIGTGGTSAGDSYLFLNNGSSARIWEVGAQSSTNAFLINNNIPNAATANMSGTTIATFNASGTVIFGANDTSVQRSSSGGYVVLNVINNANTASSYAEVNIQVGGTSSEDPHTLYTIGGSTQWVTGIDNSDSDKWKLSKGNALGTNDIIIAETNNNVTIASGDLYTIRSLASGTPQINVINQSNTINSGARIVIGCSGANAGSDLYTLYDPQVGSGNAYEVGVVVASNTWEIQGAPSNTHSYMDGTPLFKVTQTGAITKPFQPSFLAALTVSTSGGVTGNGGSYTLSTASGGTLTTVFDQGTNFVAATGIFTAPVTGKYYFESRFYCSGVTAAMTGANATIIATSRTFSGGVFNIGAVRDASNECGLLKCSAFVDMVAGNTCSTAISISGGAGNVVDVMGSAATSVVSFFQGYLVC